MQTRIKNRKGLKGKADRNMPLSSLLITCDKLDDDLSRSDSLANVTTQTPVEELLSLEVIEEEDYNRLMNVYDRVSMPVSSEQQIADRISK